MKILLIKYRNIGDTLLSSALVSNLKFHYPNSFIDFALNKGCEAMVSNNPEVHKIFEFDRNYVKNLWFFKRFFYEFRFVFKLRKENYDIVINLTEGERGAIIALFSKAKIKLGYKVRKGIFSKINIFDKVANDSKVQHSVDKDLQFITLLGRQPELKKISIYWSLGIEDDINKILKSNNVDKFVHIHPVSNWMFKCWEDDRMAKVIDYLFFNKKYNVIITGSNLKHEQDKIHKIISLCKSKPLNLAGKLSLKHLAYLSSKSIFFFGIDSAPMHIAAATDTKVISIMGASEASKWGPWVNHRTNVYKNSGIQKNSKHVVFADDDHEIFYLKGVKKCRGMLNIELESVICLLDEY